MKMSDDRHEQGKCPCCGGYSLEYDPIVVEGQQLYYPYFCPGCDFRGREWYALEFIEHSEDK